MSKASSGDTVKVHYTGRLEDGTTFDTSTGRDPLTLTLGEGQVIAGFEEAVLGMEPGETKSTSVPPEKGYGRRSDERVVEIDRKNVPEEIDVTVGQQLRVQRDDGQQQTVTVAQLTETTVTLDANHPLAGQTLVFDLELVEVV